MLHEVNAYPKPIPGKLTIANGSTIVVDVSLRNKMAGDVSILMLIWSLVLLFQPNY